MSASRPRLGVAAAARGCARLAAALALAAAAPAAWGVGQHIDSVAIRVTGPDRASVRAAIGFGLHERMVEVLETEQRLGFVFEMQVAVSRPWWPDLEYSVLRWEAELAYDNVLDSYQVTTFNGDELVADDLAAAVGAIGDVRGIEMIGEGLGDALMLSGGTVRARFEIDVGRLAPPLRIEMLSALEWDFTTGWQAWPSREVLERGP